MTLKDQFKKIKDNWLILILIGAGLFFVFFSTGGGYYSSQSFSEGMFSKNMDLAYDRSSAYGGYYDSDFAPDLTERKITKTGSLNTEVSKGTFEQSHGAILDIAAGSHSFILSQNVQSYGSGWRLYKRGTYTLKVETGAYDSVVSSLRGIGKVITFNEDSQDITARYSNTEIEIQTERARLARYESMYLSATEVSDQITLSDRIFEQERKIKYLEDSLTNLDRRIEYSTISVTLSEKRSEWAYITFVKLSQLIKSFVMSLNAFLGFFFVIIPWAIAAGIIWLIVHMINRKR